MCMCVCVCVCMCVCVYVYIYIYIYNILQMYQKLQQMEKQNVIAKSSV